MDPLPKRQAELTGPAGSTDGKDGIRGRCPDIFRIMDLLHISRVGGKRHARRRDVERSRSASWRYRR